MSDNLENKLSSEEKEIFQEVKKMENLAGDVIKKTIKLVFDQKPKLQYLSLVPSQNSIKVLESEHSTDQAIDFLIENLKIASPKKTDIKKYKIDDPKTSRTDEFYIFSYHVWWDHKTDPPQPYINLFPYFNWITISPNQRSFSEKKFPKKDGYDLFKLLNFDLSLLSYFSSLNEIIFDRNLNVLNPKLVVKEI